MRVLAIVHQRDAGPGVFAEAIRERGGRARRVDAAGAAEPPADPFGYDAVLVLGGAMNADEGERIRWIAQRGGPARGSCSSGGMPLMGLCLGGQMVAAAAGAEPRRAAGRRSAGTRSRSPPRARRTRCSAPSPPPSRPSSGTATSSRCRPARSPLARSEVCLQACRLGERAWALQFHPEVSRADALHWIEDYEADPDAVRIGIDPAVLAPRPKQKIGAFNQLGRELCRRWLDSPPPR